jgi:hypothetical protein
VTKTYNKNKYMASFVGYYPADNPQVVGLVILDEPEPVHYGGLTSGPVLLNTVRRAASSGDLPASDMSRFARLYDTTAIRHPDWADKLVAAVAPIIATTISGTTANASAENSRNTEISEEMLDTPSHSWVCGGLRTALSCAEARDEKEKLRLTPTRNADRPVVEQTPAAPGRPDCHSSR